MKKGLTRSLSLTGLALIGLSVVLYVVSEVLDRWEQAKTPGEKNMGVAVLFIIFNIPMLLDYSASWLAPWRIYGRFFPRIAN